MDELLVVRTLNIFLAAFGVYINVKYFLRVKTLYRWIKLSYAVNCGVTLMIYYFYFVQGFHSSVLNATATTLLLLTICTGGVIGMPRAKPKGHTNEPC